MNQYNEDWGFKSLAAKIRAGFTCDQCGAVFSQNETILLHTHHVDEDKSNDDPQNHRVLCKWCHRKHHLLNNPELYFIEEDEDYHRHRPCKPVRVGEVVNEVLTKYFEIQRINLPEVSHDKKT